MYLFLPWLDLLPAAFNHSPRPVFSGGRGEMRSLQGWVGKFLGSVAAALGRSPSNGCEAAPPRGVGAAAADTAPAIPTPAGRRRAAAAAHVTRLGREEEEEGIFRVPSRVLERV